MITYFTTAKDFSGNTGIAQKNAIRSWQHSQPGCQIIIFGSSNGLEKLSKEPDITVYPSVQTSQEGTPRIDDMFMKAQQLALHSICCFINADIIVTRKFADTLREIDTAIKGNYLIAGQRVDVQLDHVISFNDQWEVSFLDYVKAYGRRHAPAGSDFFAFPKGQFKPGEIPELLVGRGGWDLWMIYHGRVRNAKVIDISPTIQVVHQNHDYAHRKNGYVSYDHDAEAQINLSHIPVGETYPYTLMACNYSYKNGHVRHNFARCHPRWFLSQELHLRTHRSPFREIRAVLKFGKIVR